MSGGKKGGGYQPPAKREKLPDQIRPDLFGYPGQGFQQVPQTFTAAAKPEWMKGAFAMPSWGRDAVTGRALSQADLQPQQGFNPEIMAALGGLLGGQQQQLPTASGYGPGTNFASPGVRWEDYLRDLEERRRNWNNSGAGVGNLYG